MQRLIVTSLILGLFVACAADDDSASERAPDVGTGGASGATGGASNGGNAPLPPEAEVEADYRAPAASGRYLWVPNPASNRVALVDAINLEVTALEAGHAPTYLASLPPRGETPGGALVINALSEDASIFALRAPSKDSESEGPIDRSQVARTTVPLHQGANSWAVGERGDFAIAWTNAVAVENADPTVGYQDVTVVDLRGEEAAATRLSVGYRPSQVFIADGEEMAFVVSEPGISILQLDGESGPKVLRELFLPEDENRRRDVSFSPDGSVAFVRIEGESSVLMLELASDERATIELPAPVTDFDLSADGAVGVAVMRGTLGGAEEAAAGAAGVIVSPSEPSRLAVFDVEAIADDPTDFDLTESDELFGSVVVSADGRRAVLFTNAAASSLVTIADLGDSSLRQVDVKAPVRAAFLTDDSSQAVALLEPPAGSTKAGAFALVPITKVLPPRIEGTEAPAQFVSLSSSPNRALVTTADGSGQEGQATYLCRFPELSVERIALPSEPLASGIVPEGGRGFVAQKHPEGRVTFVTLEDGEAHTVSGFELGARVVEGD